MASKLAKYLAMRIKAGELNYNAVVEKYPDLKNEIDRYLYPNDCIC